MSGESLRKLQSLAVDLTAHETAETRGAFGRNFLGVGRVVELRGVPTGIYARSARLFVALAVDFVRDNKVAAKAIYAASDSGVVTVGFEEHPETGLSIPELAKDLGGACSPA